jgi:Cu(I)/Ag(I) efflux system membrane fusion protein
MSLRNPSVNHRFLSIAFALAVGAMSVTGCGRDAPNAKTEPQETALEHAKRHMDPTYVCPMHPQVASAEPGRCPICGMDLVVKAADASPADQPADTGQQHSEKHAHPTYTCPMHPQVLSSEPGRCPICGMDLVPKQAQDSLAGPPGDAAIEGGPTIRVPGAVVNQLGVRTAEVRRGNLARHVEGFGTFLGTKARVYRPAYGTQTRSGDDKSASEMLLAAQIFERDAPLLRVGQPLRVRFPSLGAREWTGKVSGVETQISQTSHLLQFTGTVDLEGAFIPNGMTAMVRVSVEPVPDVLLVPREAVIVTGKGARVMVAQDGGRFEQRAVDAEDFGEDEIVIRSGLKEGERVVVSAQFLLDSEANLQAALSRLSGGPAEHGTQAPAPHEGAAHEHAMAVDAKPAAAMHAAEKPAESLGEAAADGDSTKDGKHESVMSAGGMPEAMVPAATPQQAMSAHGDHAGSMHDRASPEAPAAAMPEPSVPQGATDEGTMQ